MDLGTYLRFALALVFVLALIAALAWAVRRFGLAGAIGVRRPGSRRRLALVETLAIDAKRRLVLVRRDGAEHLLLIGGEHDLLVEGGIRVADSNPDQQEPHTPAGTARKVRSDPQPGPAPAEGPLRRLHRATAPAEPKLSTPSEPERPS